MGSAANAVPTTLSYDYYPGDLSSVDYTPVVQNWIQGMSSLLCRIPTRCHTRTSTSLVLRLDYSVWKAFQYWFDHEHYCTLLECPLGQFGVRIDTGKSIRKSLASALVYSRSRFSPFSLLLTLGAHQCAIPSTIALLLAIIPGLPSSTPAKPTSRSGPTSSLVPFSIHPQIHTRQDRGKSRLRRERDGHYLMSVRGAIIMETTIWRRSESSE